MKKESNFVIPRRNKNQVQKGALSLKKNRILKTDFFHKGQNHMS